MINKILIVLVLVLTSTIHAEDQDSYKEFITPYLENETIDVPKDKLGMFKVEKLKKKIIAQLNRLAKGKD